MSSGPRVLPTGTTGHVGGRLLRTFDPTRQGRAHDPDGAHIRHWAPGLAMLPSNAIHDPTPARRREPGYLGPIRDLEQLG